jgi:outer membrane immunogenic protein
MKIKLAAASALLLASTVAGSAADLAVKARPYVAPAPIYTWTGFYLGVHVGAGWGTTETSVTSFAFDNEFDPFGLAVAQNSRSGFLGGVQAGYNWQSGIAVWGIQADFAGADIKGTTPCVVVFSCTTKSNWLATASGRLGAVIADRGLVYVKGGAAWLNNKHSVNDPIGLIGFPGQELTNASRTDLGWLLGFGVEYAFTPNWTAFIEYDYMQFDRKSTDFRINPAITDGTAVVVNADIKNSLSIAKVGINYKFDYGAPVVAKY